MCSLPSHSSLMMFLQPPFYRCTRPFHSHKYSRSICTASRLSTESTAVKPRLRTPYDLVHFRRSRFAAHLNELRKHGILPLDTVIDSPTRLDRALRDAGQLHEKRVIEHMKRLIPNAEICAIPFGHPDRYELTEDAIRQCKPLIQGAALRDDLFAGYADLLIHASVDPFSTGSGYAVCEIKLASLQKVDFVIQTATYATMLNRLQQRLNLSASTYSYLWLGSVDAAPKRLEYRTLSHFFRRVSDEYRAFLRDFKPSPIPQPDGPLEKLSPWKTYASHILEEADSLRLIAGIRRSQAREIEGATGVSTLTEYGSVDRAKVDGLIRDRLLSPVHRRLHVQAQMQIATRLTGKTAFEKLNDVPKGMPAAAKEDLFFDMEGFPLVEGGLEYLFGISDRNNFSSWWAHTRREEEKAFVQLMAFFRNALDVEDDEAQPHIFHYGRYEVIALQRVAMRATTPDGIAASHIFERLLEQGVFFDVYDFVRTSLVVGEPSYSIKQIEKLVGVSRQDDKLADAESSVGMYYEWRSMASPESEAETNYSSHQSHPILDEILHYNRQDCESLKDVVAWLRMQFPPMLGSEPRENSLDTQEIVEEKEIAGEILPGACGRSREAKIADSVVISRSAELGIQVHEKPISSLTAHAKHSLSHLLQFYVRESLPVRYAFRRRVEAAFGSLLEDTFGDDKCLTGVGLIGERADGPPGKERVLYQYSFDAKQPASLAEGESVAFVVPSTHSYHVTASNDAVNGFMTVKGVKRSEVGSGEVVLGTGKKTDFRPPSYGTLVSTEDLKVCDATLRHSIFRKSEKIAADENEDGTSLARAFLNRHKLDLHDTCSAWNASSSHGQALCEELSTFLATQKCPNVFVIQGPPGSGKTFLSARLIHSLVQKHKKTVAVSSNSHYAIDKLLCGTADVGLPKDVVYKVGRRPVDGDKVSFKANLKDLNVAPTSSEDSTKFSDLRPGNSSSRTAKAREQKSNAALVGATCYQLSQGHCDGKFDFLFVDEASQVNMANFLAMTGSSRYAVLVGDQQQLEMPLKGAHPDQVSVSCLLYAVGEGVSIVQPSRGIFLDKSYRMSPAICSFVSESFYDKALHAADACCANKIFLKRRTNSLLNIESGIQFVPCDTFLSEVLTESANVYGRWYRPAEVLALTKIVDELLGSHYVTRKVPFSAQGTLGVDDILVVAPYNAQVRALQAALPEGIRIATVDKFQGQEAPVVLISSCAGDAENIINQYSENGQEYNDSPLVEESFSGISHQLAATQRRGLRFALQKNRLNVALSRAECLAVVTGNSNACSRISLENYEDVETAALYESLQMNGTTIE